VECIRAKDGLDEICLGREMGDMVMGYPMVRTSSAGSDHSSESASQMVGNRKDLEVGSTVGPGSDPNYEGKDDRIKLILRIWFMFRCIAPEVIRLVRFLVPHRQF